MLNLSHDIGKLCLSYLPEKFCENCESLYLDSLCINCDDNWHHKKSSYKLLDEMTYLHMHTLPNNRGHLYCFKAIHMDDIQLVRQWNKQQIKDAQLNPTYCTICPDINYSLTVLSSYHLSICETRTKTGIQNIPRGQTIGISRAGSFGKDIYYSINSILY